MPGKVTNVRAAEIDTESEILIVSGLPRSGTSMMMQMLGAGGVRLLVDDTRPPDASNPRGYFEHEAVKSIKTDASFLHRSRGCAVKIASPLLRSLPERYTYRVILMERDLDEVLRSQARMLGRGESGEAEETALRNAFAVVITRVDGWLAARPSIPCLRVDHAEAIKDPAAVARSVAMFLGGRPEAAIQRMASAVEPALHRQRERARSPRLTT